MKVNYKKHRSINRYSLYWQCIYNLYLMMINKAKYHHYETWKAIIIPSLSYWVVLIGNFQMPKRKVKEDKPKKKLGKKQILLPPIAAGAATLFGLLIMHFIPTPSVLGVCLRADSVNTFNVYSRIELIVDKHTKLLPNDLGKQPKNGTEC